MQNASATPAAPSFPVPFLDMMSFMLTGKAPESTPAANRPTVEYTVEEEDDGYYD